MEQPGSKRLNPFLRDAAASFVPELTDDQLLRIGHAIVGVFPDALVSRMTDFTALIQGIAVEAETAIEANGVAWSVISQQVHDALVLDSDAGTHLTSIDVRLPSHSMFDLT
jgi:hypothetical protein